MEKPTEKIQSEQEKKIRSITQLYYSRPDVQRAIFEFSKNREISPRYYEGFGKRPDSFQFIGDIFGLVKRGATSFHSSEEIWKNPMDIETGMSEKRANELRIGWDLLVDIDCQEGMDYSARVAKAILKSLKDHGINSAGLKFSGSKGFHIIVPWDAFPKEINGVKTNELFPELPRIIMAYIKQYSEKIVQTMLPEDFYEKFKDKLDSGYKCENCGEFASEYREVEFSCSRCNIVEIRRFKMGTKGQLPVCYKCKSKMAYKPKDKFFICEKCELNSLTSPKKFSKIEQLDIYALMGLDVILVSPRHLFRMPYSLHEKSSLASVVLEEKDLEKFIEDPKYKEKVADPLRVEIKQFYKTPEENEAAELVMQALDWAKTSGFNKEVEKRAEGKFAEFKPIQLESVKSEEFPPCIKKILEGIEDGKKRAVFALINFFRSIGMDKSELEKRLYEWNDKNKDPLKKGYIYTQLIWAYKRKPILPPNCRDFYRDLGVCSPDNLCSKIKNPINYTIKKNFSNNPNSKVKKK